MSKVLEVEESTITRSIHDPNTCHLSNIISMFDHCYMI